MMPIKTERDEYNNQTQTDLYDGTIVGFVFFESR